MNFEDQLRYRPIKLAGHPVAYIEVTETERDALADAIEALRELHGWTPKTCPKVLRGFECAPCSALARLDAGGQA